MEERPGNFEDGISGPSKRREKAGLSLEDCLQEMRVCVFYPEQNH